MSGSSETVADQDAWRPVRILPNVELESAIEGRTIAIAPIEDARIRSLRQRHPAFDQLLSRFSDAFGQALAPATIVVDAAVPAIGLTVDAVSGFRDIVSASLLPAAHAANLVYGARGRPSFSDHFAIYPWMLDKNFKDMVVFTPAAHGVHMIEEFNGQGTPTIFHQKISSSEVDNVLCDALVARWHKLFVDGDDSWENRALFRSLNMANSAMLVPSGSETTQYDVGRSVALWGAAFEILVHEGPNGSSGIRQVIALLEKLPWKSAKAAAKEHLSGRKQDAQLYSIAAWLYFRLTDARNDFLHGNPIGQGVFETPTGHHLWGYAAPLYRLALTSFLGLRFAREIPPVTEVEAFTAFISDRMEFEEIQGLCERALLTATEKKPAHISRARTIKPTGEET